MTAEGGACRPCHCEPTRRANAPSTCARRPCESRDPYAVPCRFGVQSENLSVQQTPGAMGPCFRRDDERGFNCQIPHTPSPSRREAPEALHEISPKEGVGNAGCPLHPRSRVHLVVVERTRVTTSTPASPGIPARNGFNGFLRALPGDRALLPPSFANLHCIRTR